MQDRRKRVYEFTNNPKDISSGQYISQLLEDRNEEEEIPLSEAIDKLEHTISEFVPPQLREVSNKPTTTGVKHDLGKPKLSFVPVEAIEGIARGLEYGANKYGKGNYKLGMDHSRVYDALLRHTFAAIRGEDLDPESGLPHLFHIGSCYAILAYYVGNKVGKDDR